MSVFYVMTTPHLTAPHLTAPYRLTRPDQEHKRVILNIQRTPSLACICVQAGIVSRRKREKAEEEREGR